IKSQGRPLCSRNADPGCLFGECVIDKLISFVKHDVCAWLKFFERAYAADVIQVRVSDSDSLQFKTMPIDRCNYRFCIIAGIHTERTPGRVATEYARVLLKSGDANFFYDHFCLFAEYL